MIARMPHRCSPVRVSRSVAFGGPLPVLIMGPCVIESERHCLRMAAQVKKAAAAVGLPVVFKASFDKANRTSHASFRGQGLTEGLRILARVRREFDLPVTTDVHEREQVAALAEAVDLIQVPAFLCRQTDLVEACARSGVATSIKKGQFLAPQDCGNIVAKFRHAGGNGPILIERGASFGYNTLVSDFRALPIMRSFGVPVVFDATHSVQMPGGQGTSSGGAGHYAPMLMRAAMAVGVEGLFLETHDDPQSSPSDGPNMIPLRQLGKVLADVRTLHDALGRPAPPLPFAPSARARPRA
jgi:2-dehydro-3-deoxyphosphooctonate aldolase (KDO 8-P synthase)